MKREEWMADENMAICIILEMMDNVTDLSIILDGSIEQINMIYHYGYYNDLMAIEI